MKKFIIVFICVFIILFGCSKDKKDNNIEVENFNIIEIQLENEKTKPSYLPEYDYCLKLELINVLPEHLDFDKDNIGGVGGMYPAYLINNTNVDFTFFMIGAQFGEIVVSDYARTVMVVLGRNEIRRKIVNEDRIEKVGAILSEVTLKASDRIMIYSTFFNRKHFIKNNISDTTDFYFTASVTINETDVREGIWYTIIATLE